MYILDWHPRVIIFFPLLQEVNILQWENDFKQDKFKNLEQFWTERFERLADLS